MNRNQWYEYTGTAGKNYAYGFAIRITNSLDDAIANNRSVIEITHWAERISSYAASYNLYDNTSWYKMDGGYQENVTTRFDGRSSAIGVNVKAYMGYNSAVFPKGISATYYVGHNTDGTKTVTFSTMLNVQTSSLNQWTASATLTLPALPRISAVSGGSGNIGGTSAITISRASGDFNHKLYYLFGSISRKKIEYNVGTSYIWTLPTKMYAQIPSSNSGTGTIYCETYTSGGTYLGLSSCNFTAKVTNSDPVFSNSNIFYKDTNATVTAITQNDQQIVRNQSNLQVNFTAATAQNAATISKYQITFNGAMQEKTAASTINYGAVNSGNNLDLTVKAIDSRGNSTTATKTVNILDWVTPTAVITANRVNNFEDDTNLKVEATISSVDSKNGITALKYRNKKTTDTTFSDYIDIQNYTQYTISIDNKFAWDFQVLAADKFGSTTYNFTIAKGMPLLFFDVDKISIGVNRFPDHENTLEANDIYSNGIQVGALDYSKIYPVGSIYMSVNSTNPSAFFGGTWQQITGRFLLAASSTYPAGSAGGSANISISTSNLPSHSHSFSATTNSGGSHSHDIGRDVDGGSGTNRSTVHSAGTSGAQNTSPTSTDGSHTHTLSGTTGSSGSGTAFSILPPFLAVYIWQRREWLKGSFCDRMGT